MVDEASAQLAGGRRSFSAFVLPQHPDQHRPERPVLLAVDQELGERIASWPTQRARPGSDRLVRPHQWRSQAVVKKPHIVDIRVARLVSPRMVRNLRFGGQTPDAISGNAPRRRERLHRVSEWLTILAQQMTVPLVIKPDRVNVHLASSFVSQYEVLRDSSDLYETVGCQSFPHPWLMGVPHDEVQVLVFTGLLANQGVDTPAAVQPYIHARRAEPPQNLDDIRRCHRHTHQTASFRCAAAA
jgi:hypothetical protein